MSRPSRRRRNPALLRARYRTLFFLVLALAALALGHRARGGAGPGRRAPGRVLGARGAQASRPSSRTRSSSSTGCCSASPSRSPAAPRAGCCAPSPSGARPAGRGAARRVAVPRRPRRCCSSSSSRSPTRRSAAAASSRSPRSRCWSPAAASRRAACSGVRGGAAPRPHAPMVDVGTGLSTAARLPSFLEEKMAVALEEHQPLSVVYVRLEHFEDSRNFLGAEGSEELVRGVARRAERRLAADGRAFRVRPDAFVLVLPGLSLAEARADGRRPGPRRERQPHRRAPADAGDRRLLVPHRARSSTASSTAARDEALPAAVSTEVRRHRHPAGRRSVRHVGPRRRPASCHLPDAPR